MHSLPIDIIPIDIIPIDIIPHGIILTYLWFANAIMPACDSSSFLADCDSIPRRIHGGQEESHQEKGQEVCDKE